MRTTLTIEPDVWEQLERRRRKAGRSLKDEINELLRAALLEAERPAVPAEPFATRPVNTGRCTLDNLDDVEAVLDYAEGAWRR